MTTAASARATASAQEEKLKKLPTRRHKWGDPINIHRDTSPSGCDESEKPCILCGLVKITVHQPLGWPYRAWRTKLGIRFPDPKYTPVCDGEVD